MRIAIIDADLIGLKKHRFPNLACMKISGYWKSKGHDVVLELDYNNIYKYDKVFISKVFEETPVPEELLSLPFVEYGGTGFFYDKAPQLPDEIEHHMPDYTLYDDWISDSLKCGISKKELAYYTDYSIGFTTRGCIRGCSFCVNKNYKKCTRHSHVDEFVDDSKRYICLLDDNILACSQWKDIFEELNRTGKRFQFKQGMDERLLTDEKCEVIFKSKWIGDYIFAFDNIEDRTVVEEKLQLLRKYTKSKSIKFYVLCGYDRNGIYDHSFWKQDIADLFERIKILASYGCKPYIMRHKNYSKSPFAGTYINVAAWCNQPSIFFGHSYYDMCYKENLRRKGKKISSAYRYFLELNDMCKDIVDKYAYFKPKDIELNL